MIYFSKSTADLFTYFIDLLLQLFSKQTYTIDDKSYMFKGFIYIYLNMTKIYFLSIRLYFRSVTKRRCGRPILCITIHNVLKKHRTKKPSLKR